MSFAKELIYRCDLLESVKLRWTLSDHSMICSYLLNLVLVAVEPSFQTGLKLFNHGVLNEKLVMD